MLHHRVTTTDGRLVEAAEWGDPDGRPVLLMHGTPGSLLVGAHVDEAALRSHRRLVTYSRAGYGDSTPAPPSLAAGARDALAVLDALGVDEAPVVGVSGGGPYAAATALVGDARVPRLALLAGNASIIEVMEEVPPREAELADALAHGHVAEVVAAVRAESEAAMSGLVGQPADVIWTAMRTMLPPNEGTSADPHFGERMGADLARALQSLDGFVADNVAWGYGWDIDPRQVVQPALLRYGTADRMVPPAHAAWWQERLPHAELVLAEGEGHGLSTFGHWDEVLAWL